MSDPGSTHPQSHPYDGNAPACEAVADLVPGYALHALDPDDIAAVEGHLAACTRCAGEVAEFERTAALLPFLARRATPAPDVKAALFTRIAHTHKSERPIESATIEVSEPFRSLTVHSLPAATPTLPASRPMAAATPGTTGTRGRFSLPGFGGPRRWRGYTVPIATTAIPLVLALALVGGWAYSLYDDAAEARADQAMLGTFSGVFSSGNGTVYDLRAAPESPAAEGQLLASPDSDHGVLMVSGLQPEEAGRSYEVWIEQDGRMLRYATLEVDGRGDGRMLIEVDGSFKRCRGVYVQLVPADRGGSARMANVLWTTLTTPGPASGGDETEGDPQIGATSIDLLTMASSR